MEHLTHRVAGKIDPLESISVKAPPFIAERRKSYSGALRGLYRDLMWKVLFWAYWIHMMAFFCCGGFMVTGAGAKK